MPIERFANDPTPGTATTTLSGALAAGATSVAVASVADLPTKPQFRLLIESEIVTVTGPDPIASPLTVLRGQEGTADVAHADAVAVDHVLTAGALNSLVLLPEVIIGNYVSTMTNLGAGPSEFNTHARGRADLTNADEVRFLCGLTSMAGAAGSWARAQYSTDSGTTWAYLDGGTGPEVAIDAIGAKNSGWVNLATAAKAEVMLRFVAGGSDGVADPQLTMPRIQLR